MNNYDFCMAEIFCGARLTPDGNIQKVPESIILLQKTRKPIHALLRGQK